MYGSIYLSVCILLAPAWRLLPLLQARLRCFLTDAEERDDAAVACDAEEREKAAAACDAEEKEGAAAVC